MISRPLPVGVADEVVFFGGGMNVLSYVNKTAFSGIINWCLLCFSLSLACLFQHLPQLGFPG